MKRTTGKTLARLCGYIIGFNVINLAIPSMGLKEWCLVTLGGCIIIVSTVLFDN